MKNKLPAKIFSLALCLSMTASMVACAGDDSSASEASSQPQSSVADSSQADESTDDSQADEGELMEFNDKTAMQIIEEMGNGWNLGNTMEACGINASDPISYETCWGQPITELGTLEGVKAAGFDSVRIPVAWSNMMNVEDGSYKIDDAYLDRVEEIIGYVIENDMYCVVNVHWDSGWWEGFGSEDQAQRDAAMARYKAIWTQVADRYKGYSEKLIFESANEELGERYFTNMKHSEKYDLTNEINQTFVDIVRASGGNNDKRCLLIAGFETDIDKTCKNSFEMPTDTIPDHLMVSVHYYTPSTYCIASEVDNSWGYRDSWGTQEDIAEMRSYFEKLKKFTDAGYPVIIGEYGVAQIKDENGVWIHKEGCDEFIRNVLLLSEEMGYCPMLWDCSNFYDRLYFKMKDDTIAQIFLDAKAGTLAPTQFEEETDSEADVEQAA